MSRPHYGWWGYVKDIIRRYPDAVTPWEYDAVRAAIEQTGRMSNGHDRMRVIELVYWKKTCALKYAGLHVRYSEDTAQNWHADFIRAVAQNFHCDSLLSD